MNGARTRGAVTAALFAALVLLASACTGRLPARLTAGTSDTVERFDTQAPPESGSSPAAGESLPASPSPGATAPAQSAPRIVAKTRSGTVVTQAPGGLPKANIWPAEVDRAGITSSKIRLCMHAAFLLGPVFNNDPEDEDVYWLALNDAGGIHGREVEIQFVDDQYTPSGTRQALEKCKQSDPFLYLGGVGFDQAPAGREWAEEQHLPYLFNMAAEATNLIYSFSFLPSIQTNGRTIGSLVASRFPGKKLGAIYVNTPNWEAGYLEFRKELAKRGMQVAVARSIANNNEADFFTIIDDMKEAGVEVVFAYINALALTRFIAQSDQQDFHPAIVSPDGFDLVTDTSGNGSGAGIDILRRFPEGIYAVWVSPAYEYGGAGKARASVPWYSEMKAMNDAYARYKPDKVPNDVDWMFWLYSKTIHQMLADCSKECSRNILAGMMLTGYKTSVLGCPIDFALGGGRLGGHFHNVYRAQVSSDRSYWRQIETCKREF